MSKTKVDKDDLLSKIDQVFDNSSNVPIEPVLQQLAAGLMAECAHDLGLSPLELLSLLKTPRQDALAGLVTVLKSDV